MAVERVVTEVVHAKGGRMCRVPLANPHARRL